MHKKRWTTKKTSHFAQSTWLGLRNSTSVYTSSSSSVTERPQFTHTRTHLHSLTRTTFNIFFFSSFSAVADNGKMNFPSKCLEFLLENSFSFCRCHSGWICEWKIGQLIVKRRRFNQENAFSSYTTNQKKKNYNSDLCSLRVTKTKKEGNLLNNVIKSSYALHCLCTLLL